MIEISELWSKEQAYFQKFQNVSLVHGGISLDDINELDALIRKNAYRTNHSTSNIKIAEIGSWTGLSTSLLAHIAKEFSGRVVAVDTFSATEFDNLGENAKCFDIKKIFENNLIHQQLRDVVTIVNKKSEDAVSDFANEEFDVVFIDADHRYEPFKRDLTSWYPKVKHGGLICGHDCEFLLSDKDSIVKNWSNLDYIQFHPGVVLALSEIFPTAKKTDSGVIWYKVKN